MTMEKKERKQIRTILVVDDDEGLLSALERDLRSRGGVVLAAQTPVEALELARQRRPDCALLDLYIGDAYGIDLLRELRAELPDLPVLLLSGQGAVETAVDAFHVGAVDFLQKPIGGKQVVEAMERALERLRQLMPENLARAEFEHITRVMQECNGNVSEAARRLGIHRRSLQRKLQKAPPT